MDLIEISCLTVSVISGSFLLAATLGIAVGQTPEIPEGVKALG